MADALLLARLGSLLGYIRDQVNDVLRDTINPAEEEPARLTALLGEAVYDRLGQCIQDQVTEVLRDTIDPAKEELPTVDCLPGREIIEADGLLRQIGMASSADQLTILLGDAVYDRLGLGTTIRDAITDRASPVLFAGRVTRLLRYVESLIADLARAYPRLNVASQTTRNAGLTPPTANGDESEGTGGAVAATSPFDQPAANPPKATTESAPPGETQAAGGGVGEGRDGKSADVETRQKTSVPEADRILRELADKGAILTGRIARCKTWAEAIEKVSGRTCSPSTVGATAFWTEKGNPRTERGPEPTAVDLTKLKAVCLTTNVIATLAADENALNALIDETEERAVQDVMNSKLPDPEKAVIVKKLREGEMTATQAKETLRLAAGQRGEHEPSPLDPDPPDQRLRVKYHRSV
jgi:hypothetical protein